MSPDLERLVRLQQLDTTIDDARRRISAHPSRIADADTRLNGARVKVESARSRLKDNQEARRALEKDVALYQGRLSKFRDQQAAVKTNKEYQALGHEIETAQRDLGGVEEKILERMMEADSLAVDVKQVEAALAAQQKEVDAEKKALAQELAVVEESLKQAIAERATLLGGIEKKLVSLYDQVARARKGVALCTATRDGLCSVCHVRLRPQVFQLVRQNESIIQCDSCQRILYYVPPLPPVEPAVTHHS
jgi:hypothetical protein